MKLVWPLASKRDQRTSVGGSNSSVATTSVAAPFSPNIALSFFASLAVSFKHAWHPSNHLRSQSYEVSISSNLF